MQMILGFLNLNFAAKGVSVYTPLDKNTRLP